MVDMISGGKSQNLISACGKIPCAPASLGSHHVGGGVSNQSVAVAGDWGLLDRRVERGLRLATGGCMCCRGLGRLLAQLAGYRQLRYSEIKQNMCDFSCSSSLCYARVAVGI